MPNVIYDNPSFTFEGKQYPLKVFSLANPAPWSSNFICLRYELENSSNDTIPLLFWNFIDEWTATDLAAHQKLTRARRRPSESKDAIRGPSTIKAFRSEELTTPAWQTIEDRSDTRRKGSEISPFFRFARSSELDPFVERAVGAGRIQDSVIAVIKPGGDPDMPPPPVADSISGAFGRVVAGSRVDYKGQKSNSAVYQLYTFFQVEPGSDVRIEIFAPAIMTMALSPTESAATFLDLAEGERQRIAGITERNFASSFVGNLDTVYIVEHPITIRWTAPNGQGTLCIRASMYSPYPISLGKAFCTR